MAIVPFINVVDHSGEHKWRQLAGFLLVTHARAGFNREAAGAGFGFLSILSGCRIEGKAFGTKI
jgi:hypothetical protein